MLKAWSLVASLYSGYTYNDMEVYVRTLSHFFTSFSDTIKQNT